MSSISAVPSKRKLSGATVGIPPRQMTFTLPEASPRYFFGDNATATLFFAMLSGFFPPGEHFFMESVRNFRDRITDEKQKAEISGFMGQEAIHSREHDRLNEMFAERGFDMSIPERTVKIGLGILERMPHSTQLAATTFMEHFTALLAEQLLNDEQFSKRIDPEMIKIWQWHALEELEHKAVAYDVYELIGNSQRERQLAFALSTAVLLPTLAISWGWMVAKDGQLGNLRDNIQGLNMLFGREGFVTKILPKMPMFGRRGFHPNKHDTKALEKTWRDKLFGKDGQLVAEFKNRDLVAVSAA